LALSYSNAQKWEESLALLDRAAEELQQAQKHLQSCNLSAVMT
jgi:hypothetical protein